MVYVATFLLLLVHTTWCSSTIELPNKKTSTWTRGSIEFCGRSWQFQSGIWNTALSSNISLIENCTLDTQFWRTGLAHRVYIDINMRTSLCRNLSLAVGQKCRHNITLELYKGNETTTNRTFTQIAVLPLASIPYNQSESSFTNDNRIAVNGMAPFDKLQLRFRTSYFQGTINSVRVSFQMCPTVSGELVDFATQPAPDQLEGEMRINGTCTQNAVDDGKQQAYMICRYDGSYVIHGHCVCEAGYTKQGSSCKVCNFGEYKPGIGNTACLKCGANVRDGADRKSCTCLRNYYRQIGKENDDQADCHESPYAPASVDATNVTPSQATIKWSQSKSGSSPLGAYVIECDNCPHYRTEFPVRTSDTHITVLNLGAYAEYELSVYNENSATNLTGKIYPARYSFQTKEGVPGMVREVKNVSLSDGNNQFTWTAPFAKGSSSLTYVFQYGDTTVKQKFNNFLLKKEAFDKTYTIKIWGETEVNGRMLSGEVYTGQVMVPGGIDPALAFGVAGGLIVFVVLILLLAFCVWRRRNPAYLQVVRMEDGTVKLPARFYSGGSVYVDPKTYMVVDDAVCEFAFEIERKDLTVGEKIGDGEFADVHKGTLMKGGVEETVAIKTLKAGASKSDRDDFLSEAAILGQFKDPNVIFLEGVILIDEPSAIILEYMQHGALDSYLRENDMQFSVAQLLEMARGVASGMKYLSEMGFVHRDLAARNILVNEKMTCKVADFGMSLEIKVDDTVDATGGKIPIRWTAPEAIQFRKFTTASDVWSYGMVLWEIMAYGERPYWEWGNYEVLEKVNAGYRLPAPMGCPRVVHDLMLLCWNKERTKRPLFSLIRDRIDDWLEIPQLLEENGPVVKLDDQLDYTIMQTINKWLEAIGMGRYTNHFLEQGFATPRQILLLTMNDLEVLGVGSLEHRRKIFKAITNTKAQVETNLVRMNSKTATFKY